jgi:peptidyl-prolyl cis-trans isomerase SurA
MESTTETQVKARHILLRTDRGRSPEEARALANELLNRIRSGASFAELARQFSEGPSGSKGGALGWVSRGQMVPAFEELIFSLEPGQLGGPTQTQFGIHIAEVTDTRQREIDPEESRKSARNALRTRKTRERMDQWLRQLRAQAFVEVRLDDQGQATD